MLPIVSPFLLAPQLLNLFFFQICLSFAGTMHDKVSTNKVSEAFCVWWSRCFGIPFSLLILIAMQAKHNRIEINLTENLLSLGREID